MKTNVTALTIFLAFCLSLTFSACTTMAQNDDVMGEETSEFMTPTPFSTPDLSSTTSPIVPTAPLELIPTEADTSTPTNTPIAALSPEEAQAVTLNLLENNNGCQLPCWWGFIPGVTEWDTAKSTLSKISLNIIVSGTPAEKYAEVFLNVPEEISPVPLHHVYTIHDNVIHVIDVHVTMIPTYTLSQVLSLYGKPEEVWLLTGREPREGDMPFEYALFYPQQRFMIEYSVQGELQENIVVGCPSLDASILISVWSPEITFTFGDIIDRRIPDSSTVFQPLESATNMSSEQFFQTFREVDGTECIETPSELWP